MCQAGEATESVILTSMDVKTLTIASKAVKS